MAGFHGKIPSRGDFVSRGLSREVIAVLDDWFQTGMVQSRNVLDERWLGFYQVAPIWHYYLSPGIVDDNAWLGIWIPSVDKVGRNFPLTLLAPCEQRFSGINQIHPFDAWLIDSEDVLLDALEADLDFDGFCDAVEQSQPYTAVANPDLIDQAFDETRQRPGPAPELVAPAEQPPQLSPLQQRLLNLENAVKKIAQHLQIDVGLEEEVAALNADILPAVAEEQQVAAPARVYHEFEYGINLASSADVVHARELSAELEPFCLWLSDGSEAITEQLVVTKGLPDKSVFSRFLTGFE
ncbi:MAG: type VI secretion system ImpM family protein [Phenylobacterium sp.]|jgi:type VI secretion system ImpM family protein